ncbi:hypothetical protein LXL04_020671 [Taraxacum kok-saghyz]
MKVTLLTRRNIYTGVKINPEALKTKTPKQINVNFSPNRKRGVVEAGATSQQGGEKPIPNKGQTSSIPTPPFQTTITTTINLPKNPTSSKPSRPPIKGIVINPGSRSSSSIRKPVYSAFDTDLRKKASLERESDLIKEPAKEIWKQWTKQDIVEASSGGSNEYWFIPIASYSIAIDSDYQRDMLITGRPTYFERSKNEESVFTMADLPLMNLNDWISLYNILVLKGNVNFIKEYSHIKPMILSYMYEIGKFDIEVILTKTLKPHMEELSYEVHGPILYELVIDDPWDVIIVVNEDNKTRNKKLLMCGGRYLTVKQVFPVEDYQQKVSQRLVEAAHANDLNAALECLADPFVDVNFAGTVCLNSKKTEIVLHDESPSEVLVELEEFNTDVTSLFLAAHSGNVKLVTNLLRNGANVDKKLFRGYATTAATRGCHVDILELLLEGGASQVACEEALIEASHLGLAAPAKALMASDLIRPNVAVHALVIASCRGFIDVVDTLLKCGVDMNGTARVLLRSSKPFLHKDVSCNALVAAIVNRHISLVQLLLKAGARTDTKVSLGAWSWDPTTGEEFRVGAGLAEPYNITWCAVEYFEETGSILNTLLRSISPNIPHFGRTIIHHAILCSNLKAIEVLLNGGADPEIPIQTIKGTGFRLIHLAADNGYSAVLHHLVNAGCNIDSRTDTGETAIMICARNKHAECLRVLAGAGADLGLVNSANQCVQSIAGSIRWTLGLRQAILEVVRTGKVPRSTDSLIFSPLMFVTRVNDIDALKKLVNQPHGVVDLDEQDENGYSAVMVAVINRHVEAFRVLVSAGANVNLQNKYGETGISLSEASVYCSTFEKVILEFQNDINPSEKEFSFYTLHRAVAKGDFDTVKSLTNGENDINAPDGDGYTPLMLAAREGHGKICEFLISKGAICDIENARHETALQLSCKDARQVLLDHMARVLVLGGGRVKKHCKRGKGCPHSKRLSMMEDSGVLRWGKSSRRNVVCKWAEVGGSATSQQGGEKPIPNKGQTSSIPTPPFQTTITTTINLPKNPTSSKPSRPPLKGIVINPGSRSSSSIRKPVYSAFDTDLRKKASLERESDLIKEPAKEIWKQWTKQDIVEASSGGSNEYWFIPIASYSIAIDSDYQRDMLITGRPTYFERSKNEESVFTMADLPLMNLNDWISLYNILVLKGNVNFIKEYSHIKPMILSYMYEIGKFDIEVILTKTLKPHMEELSYEVHGPILYELVIDDPWDVIIVVNEDNKTRNKKLLMCGGRYLTVKQVFPVEDYQQKVSQRLVEAAHANDLNAALECLADPFVDVNFAGTVCLNSKKTEIVLHDESPSEVLVELEEFNTDVTSLFLAAHSGNVKLVTNLLRNGANVDKKLFRGYATTAATRGCHVDILELLLEGGASQVACEEALIEASHLGLAAPAKALMASDLIRPNVAVHALVIASCRGFIDVVDTLLKCGVDMNGTARVLLRSSKPFLHKDVSCNALVAAIVNRHISLVQLLLKAGARTDTKVSLGAWSWDPTTGEEFRVGAGLAEPYNITWCAVEYFEETGSILNTLLRSISPNIPHFGRTIIHHAILCSNLKAIEVLLNGGADPEIPIQTIKGTGFRLIHLAADNGYSAVLHHLVNAGCNIDSRTDTGETAIMICARNKHAECLRVLAGAGADLGLVNSANQCVQSIAGSVRWTLGLRQAILEMVRTGKVPRSTDSLIFSPLMFVTRVNDIDALKKLVNQPHGVVDLDEQDENGYSAVMVAVINRHVEAFRVLVSSGANVNLQNKYGETAISLSEASVDCSAFEKVILEFQNNINPSEKEFSFYTLHRAVAKGDFDTVKSLTNGENDINAPDGDGYTPLMLAARKGHGKICEFLISKGAICDIENARHETALQLSCKDARQVLFDHMARVLVLGGGRVKKHCKRGKGCPHSKRLSMVEDSGVLRWGKSSRRNVVCKWAEVGGSSSFRWNRRKKVDGDEAGLFRVVTTRNKEVHFVCEGGVDMAELWVRGIKLVTREAIFGN